MFKTLVVLVAFVHFVDSGGDSGGFSNFVNLQNDLQGKSDDDGNFRPAISGGTTFSILSEPVHKSEPSRSLKFRKVKHTRLPKVTIPITKKPKTTATIPKTKIPRPTPRTKPTRSKTKPTPKSIKDKNSKTTPPKVPTPKHTKHPKITKPTKTSKSPATSQLPRIPKPTKPSKPPGF